MTLILGIESSCDETAAAVVIDGRTMASNVIASQIDLHAKYGGVYPEVASRAHIEAIGWVVDQALTEAGVAAEQLDAIAVTRGPGLVGSLLVGINYAKGLAFALDKPLLGINHLEGHVYSLWLTETGREIEFPVLVLIVSGGHTELILMTGHGEYELLGSTLDDAAGEAFDKVGRMLGLPFPGGPNIERAAMQGNPGPSTSRAGSTRPTISASPGWKPPSCAKRPSRHRRRSAASAWATSSRRCAATSPSSTLPPASRKRWSTRWSEKTTRAAHGVTEILMAGGVSANQLLRREMRALARAAGAFSGRWRFAPTTPP
ncbi:MAG: tRNA (adenosine(37)-N6)-threonylcarbamoyltransferase complex transferase subunit TsaD [Anaerolineae bacterium]